MSRIYEALPATLNEMGEKADEFQYFAEDNDFIEEANEQKLALVVYLQQMEIPLFLV